MNKEDKDHFLIYQLVVTSGDLCYHYHSLSWFFVSLVSTLAISRFLIPLLCTWLVLLLLLHTCSTFYTCLVEQTIGEPSRTGGTD